LTEQAVGRIRRASRLLALGLALFLLVFVFGWVPYWLVDRFTTGRFQMTDRENQGLTPASFQLDFEDVAFNAKDGVPLKGWWVPAPSARGSVVLVHGLNRSRIEMVKKVPFLHGEGWNALLFDLRLHGESGGSMRTLGGRERLDVAAAVDEARRRAPGPVVLWGISFGAATAVMAAADDPEIAGVVCDSSFRSLRDTAKHHLALFRGFRWWARVVPSWPVADEVLFWFRRKTGIDPDELDVEKAAARLAPRPALFVANSGDRRMPQEIAFALQKAAGAQASVLVVPGQSHGGAWREGTAPYEEAVRKLLADAGGSAAHRQVAAREAGRAGQESVP
jgi:pimeloyl-ACP methyl ester carboxylesterase